MLVEDEAEQDDCKPDGRASRALNARPSTAAARPEASGLSRRERAAQAEACATCATWNLLGSVTTLPELHRLKPVPPGTVDASGFVDLSHAINVRFTPVISMYVHLSLF